MDENNTTFKTGCKSCQKITNHRVLKKHTEYPPEEYDYHAKMEYKIIQCLGCDNISFRYEFHDYEDIYHPEYPGDPGYELTVENYPKFLDSEIGIKETEPIPKIIKEIYLETIESITNENYILAGIGLRAIIEAIVNVENISGKSLNVKINNLVKNGVLSKKDADKLHAIRFMGNDSAHELKAYEKKKIILAFEIIENVIKSLYIFDSISYLSLELPINSYNEFEELLMKSIKENQSIILGNKATLKSILGRNIRRVSDINYYENELIQNIDNGKFVELEYFGEKNNDNTKIFYKLSNENET